MSNFENPSVGFNYSTTEKVDWTIQDLIDTWTLTLASLTWVKLQHLKADIDDAKNSYLRIRDDNWKIIWRLKEWEKEEITFLDKKEISTKNWNKVFLKIQTWKTTWWVSADYMKADISNVKAVKKVVSKKVTQKDNSEIITKEEKIEEDNGKIIEPFTPSYKKVEWWIADWDGKYIWKDSEKINIKETENKKTWEEKSDEYLWIERKKDKVDLFTPSYKKVEWWIADWDGKYIWNDIENINDYITIDWEDTSKNTNEENIFIKWKEINISKDFIITIDWTDKLIEKDYIEKMVTFSTEYRIIYFNDWSNPILLSNLNNDWIEFAESEKNNWFEVFDLMDKWIMVFNWKEFISYNWNKIFKSEDIIDRNTIILALEENKEVLLDNKWNNILWTNVTYKNIFSAKNNEFIILKDNDNFSLINRDWSIKTLNWVSEFYNLGYDEESGKYYYDVIWEDNVITSKESDKKDIDHFSQDDLVLGNKIIEKLELSDEYLKKMLNLTEKNINEILNIKSADEFIDNYFLKNKIEGLPINDEMITLFKEKYSEKFNWILKLIKEELDWNKVTKKELAWILGYITKVYLDIFKDIFPNIKLNIDDVLSELWKNREMFNSMIKKGNLQ